MEDGKERKRSNGVRSVHLTNRWRAPPDSIAQLDLPQFCQGHGQKAWVTERDQMGAGVEE
jgi:hypothetical protein